MQSDGKKPMEKHHIQESVCETRPPYRQGRKLTAVKVYTVTSESQHLFIYGVPKISLRSELKSLCMRYGPIKNLHVVTDRETEIFTECFHVQYERIQSARIAKRLLDTRSFYGHLLHVCYAPEFESLQETRHKLKQRRLEVSRKMNADNNKEGDVKRVQKYIDDIEDPVLAKRFCKKEAAEASESHKKFKIIENSLCYGPMLNDFKKFKRQINYVEEDSPSTSANKTDEQQKEQNETVFTPSPVVKANLNECAKRIVFRKRGFGLHDDTPN